MNPIEAVLRATEWKPHAAEKTTGALLELAEIVDGLVHTPPNACPYCNGLGVVIRESARGRFYEWPCIAECPPPLIQLRANRRRLA
jgi:hypothetical protein